MTVLAPAFVLACALATAPVYAFDGGSAASAASVAGAYSTHSIDSPPPRLARRADAARRDRYPWGTAPFTYFGDDTPLREVLRDFAAQYTVRVSIDSRVGGTVHGKLAAASPSGFLDQLADGYGLDWFYAKGTLYVSRRADRVAKMMSLRAHTAAEIARMLRGVGVFDARFGWTELPRDGQLVVDAPAAYVRMVEAALDALPDDPDALEFGFFALRHARVQDRTIHYRDQQIIVPGLASIISALLATDVPPANRASTRRTSALPALPALTGLGALGALAGGGSRRAAPDSDDTSELPDGPMPGELAQGSDTIDAPQTGSPISVVADTRMNALVIRAPKDVLAACRTLIERLDVAVPLVQIEAVIVDIDDSVARQLGVDWSFSAPHVSFSTDEREQRGNGRDGPEGGLSTILPSRINFMARIHALEQDGRARVVSRPSILTQNNAAALLDLSETFYIRNRGERVAETIPVTAGLMLDIVPGVVDMAEPAPRVVMDIQIEDGHRVNEMVEDLPVVKRSTISTQAVVRDGQSLLIAGHQVDRSQTNDQGIPGLSSIPLLGALFKRTERSNTTSKRFFLITPRIIDIDAPEEAALPDDADLTDAMASTGRVVMARPRAGQATETPEAATEATETEQPTQPAAASAQPFQTESYGDDDYAMEALP